MENLLNQEKKLKHLYEKVPGIKDYNTVIIDLFSIFYNKDCNIIIEENHKTSKLDQTPYYPHNRNFRLHIGIFEREEFPLEIIWSILHELGHLGQEAPTILEQTSNTPEKYNRECDAWVKAYKKLLEYDILLEHVNDFQKYRTVKENSYRPKT